MVPPPISTHAPPIPLVPISLVPHPIGPFSPAGPPIHKSLPHCLNSLAPFPLVPICNPFYPVLIDTLSHRSPNVTLVIQFSLVPHLIRPPMYSSLYSSHWSPISLVPQSNPFYPVLIGPPSHWSPISMVPPPISTHAPPIPLVPISLVPHPIGPSHRLVPQFISPCHIVWTLWPHSHWSPLVTLSTLFSLIPYLIGPPM